MLIYMCSVYVGSDAVLASEASEQSDREFLQHAKSFLNSE